MLTYTICGAQLTWPIITIRPPMSDVRCLSLKPMTEVWPVHNDENKKYMKMTNNAILEGSSQQAFKDAIGGMVKDHNT